MHTGPLKLCDVLLVSLFRIGAAKHEQLRITLRDVQDAGADIHERITDLLIKQKGVSFQDMGTVARTFREYLDYEPPKLACVNDIIVAPRPDIAS
jgi:hypothetical protein